MTTLDATKMNKEVAPPQPLPVWREHLTAAIFGLLSVALSWKPLWGLVNLSIHDEKASHILLIPLISASLVWWQRKHIFATARFYPAAGVPLLLLSALIWINTSPPHASPNSTDQLSVAALLIVMLWIAVFAFCYGIGSSKAAAFPLLFLLLTIPLPGFAADYTVSTLQKGSAESCVALFRLLGVPFVHHGLVFSLPGVDIEIAEQCSGIRSSLSLLIAGLLAQHLLLKGAWRKAGFMASVVPIAILKNAVRIVTISWLGIHVDPDFFHGALHRRGGLPFSLLGLALMALLLWLLTRPMTVRFTRRSAIT